MENNFNINEHSQALINELISQGWQFMLVWSDFRRIGEKGNHPTWYWEADFTKQIEGDGYDNHESGFHNNDPNEAIKVAYQNIKNGKRLKK